MTARRQGSVDRIAQPLVAGDGDFGVVICQSGEVVIGCGNGDVVLGEGDAVLVGRQHMAHLDSNGARLLDIWMSRDRLASRVMHVDDLVMRRMSAQTPILARLAEHAGALLQYGSAASAIRHPGAVHDYIEDLVALTLSASRSEDDVRSRQGRGATRLIAAKIHIIENSFRKSLSIKALALQLGLTTRHIQRLFEVDGSTFSAVLLDHRLNGAYRILLDARYQKRPVSQIAYDVGFGDLSYFNRCFRRRFGETPSAIRQAMLSDRLPDGD